MHLQINITGVLQFSYQKLQIQTEKHLKPLQTNKQKNQKQAGDWGSAMFQEEIQNYSGLIFGGNYSDSCYLL